MRFFLFGLSLIALSATAHGIIAVWAMRVFPALGRRRRAVVAVTALLVLAAPVARLLSKRIHGAAVAELTAFAMLELMTVLVGMLPFSAVLLAVRIIPRSAPAPAPAPLLSRREALERIGGSAAFGATVALLGWGMARGRHAFVVEELVVKLPGLPRALDGYTIAQVSDIHVGTFVGERELREGLDRVRSLKPDLIVATGDLVDFDPRYAPMAAQHLAGLRARDGVVAILGNHEYYVGRDAVLDALAAAGVEALVNEGRVVRPGDGGGFALLGVDDVWARRSGGRGPDLDRALAMVPGDRARVLLAHQPTFVREAAGRVGLQLSGHTHGGQINPGFSPAKLLFPYVAGRYDVRGTVLYVNRGFGVVGPPARIGAPPEVTKIVLVSA